MCYICIIYKILKIKDIYFNLFFYLQHDVLQSKLSEIFNTLSVEPRNTVSTTGQQTDAKLSPTPSYEIHFPELFVY